LHDIKIKSIYVLNLTSFIKNNINISFYDKKVLTKILEGSIFRKIKEGYLR